MDKNFFNKPQKECTSKKNQKTKFFTLCFAGTLLLSSCGKEMQTHIAPTEAGTATPSLSSAVSTDPQTPSAQAQQPSSTPANMPSPTTAEELPSPTATASIPLTSTPLPTKPLPLTPTPLPTETISPTPTPLPTKTIPPAPTSPPGPKISYLSIPMKGGDIAVYISEEPTQPQVMIRKKGENLCSFDWDYNLEYGSPAAYEVKDPEKLESLGLTDGDGFLAIWLPVKAASEYALPYYESHQVHCLSLKALSDFTSGTAEDILCGSSAGEKLLETLTTGYAKSGNHSIQKDQNLFSIFSQDGNVL